jgi:uncharacterized peroxidase-related enzyme
MSWVPLVTVEEATSETKNIYDFLQNNWGFVPNYYQALGPYPQLLKDQVDMFTHVMFVERALTREIKEQIALVVSGINLSNYCLAAHLEILGRLGFDRAFARKLAMNFEAAAVEPKVMALFKFVAKVSRQPADMVRQDFDTVREAGWTDAEITEGALVASLYACANRFSAAIGLVADF